MFNFIREQAPTLYVRALLALAASLLLSVIPDAVNARQCVRPTGSATVVHATAKVEIIVSADDHPHFKDEKQRCQHYWPYFSGKARKPDGARLKQEECRRFASSLKLSDGYAPLGVFLRSRVAHPSSGVTRYDWEIRGPLDQPGPPLVATYDSFNAGFVFDTPGQYEASLLVGFADGSQAQDKYRINVWPRDGTTYYVDAELGDDRFDGRRMTPQNGCEPATTAVGTCPGPWKTATRAFSILDPRDWRMKGTQRYTSDSICLSTTNSLATRYPDGEYTRYRGQTAQYPEALKDKAGRFLPPYEVHACERLAPRLNSPTKPGDQVLFKRGQTFEFETGVRAIESSKRNLDNKVLGFEKLVCTPMISPPHWATPMGLLFGAYGSGEKPVIQNTGQHSCMAFQLNGVGILHLAFQDLDIDLESANGPKPNNRASLMFANGNPINLVLNRTSIRRFDQGMLFYNAHGVFVQDSRFHDSKVVHLYSETATDVALIGNDFDYSGNHIAYTNMSNALVTRNSFKRQAFGRTALRIFGSDMEHPTESVWISGNSFTGWLDPRTVADCADGNRCQFADGKRYNYSLVEFHPNVPNLDRFSERIVFTRNVLRDAENMLRVGGVHGLIVKDNIFDTKDGSGTPRILLTDGSRRPVDDLLVEGNLFIERAAAAATIPSPQVELTDYGQIACDDLPAHSKIRVVRNRTLRQKDVCSVRRASASPAQRTCLDGIERKDIRPGHMKDTTVSLNQYPILGSGNSVAEEIDAVKRRWGKTAIPRNN